MQESHKQMIQAFMACTGAAREDAIKYLEAEEYDFDFALADYEYDKITSEDEVRWRAASNETKL